MNPDRIWIVLVIMVVVIGGANLVMFAMARSFGRSNIHFFKNFSDAAGPWKKEDEGLKELNDRVNKLRDEQKK